MIGYLLDFNKKRPVSKNQPGRPFSKDFYYRIKLIRSQLCAEGKTLMGSGARTIYLSFGLFLFLAKAIACPNNLIKDTSKEQNSDRKIKNNMTNLLTIVSRFVMLLKSARCLYFKV